MMYWNPRADKRENSYESPKWVGGSHRLIPKRREYNPRPNNMAHISLYNEIIKSPGAICVYPAKPSSPSTLLSAWLICFLRWAVRVAALRLRTVLDT